MYPYQIGRPLPEEVFQALPSEQQEWIRKIHELAEEQREQSSKEGLSQMQTLLNNLSSVGLGDLCTLRHIASHFKLQLEGWGQT